MNKGQYYRLLLSTAANPTKVIAAAKDMTLHGSANTEESSTKDTTGNATEYEVTGLNYDISGGALVLTDDDSLGGQTANTLNDFLTNFNDTLLYWRICLMKGTNNRTVDKELFSGTGKLTNLSISAQNRQNTTYNYTLTGYGSITVASSQSNS